MDVLQLRDSGELSDITVYVNSDRFKLHKFPLYTKSEFFKEIASSSPACELTDFPGGGKTFSKIADFCYGKQIEITPQDVVQLSVGSDVLKMKGKDNMCDMTRKYIARIFADANYRKDIWKVICIACNSCSLKNESAKKLYEEAMDFLESIWLPEGDSGSFTPRLTKGCFSKTPQSENDNTTEYLSYLPLEAILRLLNTAKERSCNQKNIRLVAKYLARVLDRYSNTKANTKTAESPTSPENKDTENPPSDNKGQSKVDGNPDGGNNSCQCVSKLPEEDRMQLEKLYSEAQPPTLAVNNHTNNFEKVLDTVDDVTPISDHININWITTALQLTDNNAVTAKCRRKVLTIAYNMLPRMNSEDLGEITPKVLGDIITVFDAKERSLPATPLTQSRRSSRRVSTTDNLPKNDEEDQTALRKQSIARQPSIPEVDVGKSQNEPERQLPETVSKSVIQYMVKQAEEGKLTIPEYVRLASRLKLPDNDYDSTDNLVKIFHKISKSDEKPSDEDIEKILKQINLSNCSPETLNEALEVNLFPPKVLAEAAINVAKRQQKAPQLSNCPPYQPAIRETSISPVRSSWYSSSYSPCSMSPSAHLSRTRCPDPLHQMSRCSRSDLFRSSSPIPTSSLTWRSQFRAKPWNCPKSSYKPTASSYRRFPEFATTDELLDEYENMYLDSPTRCPQHHKCSSRTYSPMSRF